MSLSRRMPKLFSAFATAALTTSCRVRATMRGENRSWVRASVTLSPRMRASTGSAFLRAVFTEDADAVAVSRRMAALGVWLSTSDRIEPVGEGAAPELLFLDAAATSSFTAIFDRGVGLETAVLDARESVRSTLRAAKIDRARDMEPRSLA
eukprot:Amastigsp_a676632_813.p2 type:complete len:151 gc:universal Amastigsp_a676632_813:478-26(-)